MTPRKYRGVVIKESLKEPHILEEFGIVSQKVTDEDNPDDRWHIYTVDVSRSDIGRLAQSIKSPEWYMHFYQGGEIIVVFHDRLFAFSGDDQVRRLEAVRHGLKLGIPRGQLDFKTK